MIRTSTIAVVVIIATGILLGTAVTGQSQEESERIQASRMKWEKHYYDRVDQFKRENAAAKNIVMVGSSHVERFDTDRHLPGRRIVNRGIGSDRIGITGRGILHRLDESVFDCNPGFVILENGVNDLGELWRHGTPSIDEIEACYRKVVEKIRTRLPDVPLVIVGLFPTRDKYAELNGNIVEFNRRLEKIAADHDCQFMDVFTPFADEAGQLREEFSVEGLHLTDAGYAQWARQIKEVLPPRKVAETPVPALRTALAQTRGDVRITLVGVAAGTAFLETKHDMPEEKHGSEPISYIEAVFLVERLSDKPADGRNGEVIFTGPDGAIDARASEMIVQDYEMAQRHPSSSTLLKLPPVGMDTVAAVVYTEREAALKMSTLPDQVTITATYFGETFVFKNVSLP